jgi:hypothetical protein
MALAGSSAGAMEVDAAIGLMDGDLAAAAAPLDLDEKAVMTNGEVSVLLDEVALVALARLALAPALSSRSLILHRQHVSQATTLCTAQARL